MNLIRKEWLLFLRDGRAGLLLLALGGLFFAAALMTGWQQESYRRSAEQSAQAEYARWLAQSPKFAHSAAHYGMWALKAPPALAVADPGISAFVGSAVWMEAHLQNELLYRPAQDAGVSERFGALSPTVVIAVFAPLLLLLMGFGTVAREREQGLWSLSLVQVPEIRKVLLAKVWALSGLVVLAVVPGMLCIAYFVQSAGASADMWARTVLWMAGAIIYLTIIAALVVTASAVIRSSARVLGVGLAVWVFAMVLVPRISLGIAERVAPLPTQQAFSRELKAELAAPDAVTTQQLQELQQRLLQQYKVSDASQLPVNLTGARLQAGEEHGDKIFDAWWLAQFDGIDAQQRIARRAGFMSPAMAFRAFSQAIAGTDFAQHRAFVVQAESHRRLIQRVMNDDILKNPEVNGQRHLSDASLWSQVPAFAFQLPALQSLRDSWLTPLMVLFGWLLLASFLVGVYSSRESRSLR